MLLEQETSCQLLNWLHFDRVQMDLEGTLSIFQNFKLTDYADLQSTLRTVLSFRSISWLLFDKLVVDLEGSLPSSYQKLIAYTDHHSMPEISPSVRPPSWGHFDKVWPREGIFLPRDNMKLIDSIELLSMRERCHSIIR